ncbi:hypothetical protein [Phaeocystidibacter marisrubri]|uniref:T9SS type A sorting domain-containing protein n=1 Tax=Phaeocystidibacter marisrubri TaxID=1577780 RepID=A0A6L3ZDH8_9FLAO|nr:hypothetical protein [Phaeocystidibacter marisrubri]KAB2815696.1 hypothetical protein F8C82_08320 [Phaeocystidibacter marisrubri]GGH65237.1 hypothetical protein GCM10011318_02040 [Phaeocystidibacter marisrubri]
MKTFLFILAFAMGTTLSATSTAPQLPAPISVQMVQWKMERANKLVVFNYINPLKADLQLSIYGPNGERIHLQKLNGTENTNLGLDLSEMSHGEYRITLESGQFLLSDEIVELY